MEITPKQILDNAIKHCGLSNYNELAERIKKRSSVVYGWVSRGSVPMKAARLISAKCGIPLKDLLTHDPSAPDANDRGSLGGDKALQPAGSKSILDAPTRPGLLEQIAADVADCKRILLALPALAVTAEQEPKESGQTPDANVGTSSKSRKAAGAGK
jgi:hypothetical protein